MAHILAKLSDVKFEDVKRKLDEDAAHHAQQGMYLEHLWRNAENLNELLFLFRVNDLGRAMQLMKKVHEEARQNDPKVKLPQLIFLDGN